jgi:hypothetical protein
MFGAHDVWGPRRVFVLRVKSHYFRISVVLSQIRRSGRSVRHVSHMHYLYAVLLCTVTPYSLVGDYQRSMELDASVFRVGSGDMFLRHFDVDLQDCGIS